MKNKMDIKNMTLMGEYIIVESIEKNEISGFIMPENKKEKPTMGKVLKVGNGHVSDKKIPMIITEESVVLFNEWSAKSLEIMSNGKSKNIFYLKQSDIIAFTEDK